jgi:hypothetical protein
MSNLLKGLSTGENIKTETDSVGGGGPVPSGIYPSVVTMAFLQTSKSGALGVNLHLKEDGGKTIRQVIYITSGNAKGNKNTFEKDGVTSFLPGYNSIDSLCLLTVGSGLTEMDTETKVVNVYDFDQKKEVPTEVEVIVGLLGQRIQAGIQKQIVDKNVLNGEGKYVPSGETREVNEIDKFFRDEDGMTTAEIRGGAEEAGFYADWKKTWTGVVRNRTSNTTAATAGGSGTPGANAAPKKSLFKPAG